MSHNDFEISMPNGKVKEIRVMPNSFVQNDIDEQAERIRKAHGFVSKKPVDQRQVADLEAFIAKARKGSTY